jgi:hypothetical protein
MVDLNLPKCFGFSFLSTFTFNKKEFLILGGGLLNDYTEKSKEIRLIKL